MLGSQKKSGFTTVELMIVIGIIAIMSSVAIPTMYAWLPNFHFRDATQSLQHDINFAKISAMKRNTSVHVRLVDTGACPVTTSAFPTATSSYTVAAENDDGTEDTLRNVTIYSDVTLCDCADVTFSNDIIFLPNGLPDIATAMGTCTVNSNLRQMGIAINLTGNIVTN